MKNELNTSLRRRFGSLDKLILANKPIMITPQAITKNMLQQEQRLNKIHKNESQIQKESIFQKQNMQSLKKNLTYVSELAKIEHIQNSRTKQKIFMLSEINQRNEIQLKSLRDQVKYLTEQLNKQYSYKQQILNQKSRLEKKNQQFLRNTQTLQQMQSKIEILLNEKKQLSSKIDDINPLKTRIKTLELQVRILSVQNQQMTKNMNKLTIQKQEYQEALNKLKPDAQKQQQKLKYYERVISDLQKRIEKLLIRQNDLLKKIDNLKSSLNIKIQQSKNSTSYIQTLTKQIQQISNQLKDYKTKYQQKILQNSQMQKQLQLSSTRIKQLENQLIEKHKYYSNQTEENKDLKLKNSLLQQHELHLRKSIQEFKHISQQVNLVILAKDAKIDKLKKIAEHATQKVQQNMQIFEKFSTFMVETGEKNRKEQKQSVQSLLSKIYELQMRSNYLQSELDEKVVLFAQQRDNLRRQLEIHQTEYPQQDINLYRDILQQKNEQLRMMENSNQILLKVKLGFQQKIRELKKTIDNQYAQNTNLKLRVVEFYKLGKEHEQLKQKQKRHLLMIQQLMHDKQQLNEQIASLKERLSKLGDDLFKIEYQYKDRGYKIQQFEKLFSQLDMETLEERKQKIQKREMIMQDYIQKLSNAIKSVNIFFCCCLCNRILTNPITILYCGHNYCEKCKKGYQDSCYDCNTGLSVQLKFKNRHLTEATTKFKFLWIIFQEALSSLKRQVQV